MTSVSLEVSPFRCFSRRDHGTGTLQIPGSTESGTQAPVELTVSFDLMWRMVETLHPPVKLYKW